jgi:hypothetical protein
MIETFSSRFDSIRPSRVVVSVLVTLALASPVHAQSSGFRIRLEPTYMNPYGNDRHVLTLHQINLSPLVDRKTGVTLDTESGLAYLGGLSYTKGRWTWGTDFFWFADTRQEVPDITLSGGTASDVAVIEVADQTFTSSTSGQVLFYHALEDTEMAAWTLDFYGMRTLTESRGGWLGLQLGIRFGDFDNDYRAVAGVENTNGVRIDASSNYGRMTGPLVGLAGTIQQGRISFDGYLGQSVIMGQPAFEVIARRFTGAFNDSPTVVAEESFDTARDIAIPITELRIRAKFGLMDQVSLGAGIHASSWWDVGVPPGTVPIPNGDQVLQENTLVFFGVMGVLEIKF